MLNMQYCISNMLKVSPIAFGCEVKQLYLFIDGTELRY